MKKLIYIDTETTGLDPVKNALTQVAAIIVIDGEEVASKALDINPFTYGYNVQIDDVALQITGKTASLIDTYPNQEAQFKEFISFCQKHIDPNDKQDAFQIVGYNTSFDIGFMKTWFRINHVHFGEYFNYKDVDVFALVKHMRLWGMLEGCKDDKLGTVCEYYGIELDAHDARNDIMATRKLYQMLTEQYVTMGAKL